jgi:hypothetical protein
LKKRAQGSFTILETNYEGFLVAIGCRGSELNVYILTRKPSPEVIDQETIENVLDAYFGIDYESKLGLRSVFQDAERCTYIKTPKFEGAAAQA